MVAFGGDVFRVAARQFRYYDNRMTAGRKRRLTERRLDRMASLADEAGDEEDTAGTCPKCEGKMVGKKEDLVPEGSVTTLRCIQCGYVYMQRS